jgi:hypothetical protein
MDELAVTGPVDTGFDVWGLATAVVVGTAVLLVLASEWFTKMPMTATGTAMTVAQAAQTNTFPSNVMPLKKTANPDDRLGGRLYRRNAGCVPPARAMCFTLGLIYLSGWSGVRR